MKKIIIGTMIISISISLLAVVNSQPEYNTNKFTKCLGCHGQKFEKKAFGKSKIVKDMNKTEISTAINGYKNGNYGGSMKGLMKGMVKDFNNTDIEHLVKFIKIKNEN